jgi:hypothetical protein
MQLVHTEEVTGSILSIATQQTEAAYRFYLAHGIDEAGRKVLCEKIWDSSTRYRQVITTDRSLVLELGLSRVLELAPSVLSATADYSLELIWAISDNYITNLAVECSGAFGAI